MPYPQKTLSDLQSAAWNDIVASNVTQGKAILPRSILRPLSWMFANLTWGNYDYIAWCFRQCVPWTATDENLDAWAALRGIYRKDATAATGTLAFTGGTPATELPLGTTIMRADGVDYTTTALGTVAADGTMAVSVTCAQTGATGNCDTGTAFGLLTAVAGIPASAVAQGVVTGGADIETDSDFRTRMLSAYASRDGGGRASDYVEWAQAVAGVTRAWCSPNGAGDGTVVVYFMMDDAQAVHDGFPQGVNGAASDETRYTAAQGDQLTVANAIRVNQPVTALVIACAPVAFPVNVTLANLSPNTADQIAAMQTALADLFVREGSPLGMTVAQSDIETALLSTGASFTLSAPAGPTAVPLGSLPAVGVVSATS
ncbi:MAG: baseplate J/gp47 family protein [Acetobacter indonesiensis]|jgi:uncharacterized phage protein gp47/JayE|nr:baseplate J/gp47 family protein [Acetobacter indonesiensis]MCI1545337.1 baseplate J/gp47 family protein [Acetobacter indonesiensis]MCI1764419.1 baseplate J/gp47 family protein [Acetobacter indonesiensis]